MKITLSEIQFLMDVLKQLQFQVGSSKQMMLAEAIQVKLNEEAKTILNAEKEKNAADKPPA